MLKSAKTLPEQSSEPLNIFINAGRLERGLDRRMGSDIKRDTQLEPNEGDQRSLWARHADRTDTTKSVQ